MSKETNPVNIAGKRIVKAQIELNRALEDYQLVVEAYLEGVTQEHKIWAKPSQWRVLTNERENASNR